LHQVSLALHQNCTKHYLPVGRLRLSGQVAFCKIIYSDLETLQADLDEWIDYYNNELYPSG